MQFIHEQNLVKLPLTNCTSGAELSTMVACTATNAGIILLLLKGNVMFAASPVRCGGNLGATVPATGSGINSLLEYLPLAGEKVQLTRIGLDHWIQTRVSGILFTLAEWKVFFSSSCVS